MRNMYRNHHVVPLIAAAILTTVAVCVPTIMAAESTPCLEEIEKYCGNIKPGEGILNCLQKHDPDLSAVCREKLQTNRKNLLNAQQICAKDIESFCKGVVPGGGRILKCLGGHRDELTPACREIISARIKPTAAAANPADTSVAKPAEQPSKKPVTTTSESPRVK